jgi:aminoglycoside phosphotransferase (APT) family kinase protein
VPVKPPAEVDLTEDLVRTLLAAQHPDLADLPLRPAAQGWDNGMFRLGEHLAVRLPRREMGAALARHEQQWLPVLAGLCPVPVPAPVRLGVPSDGYPWSWSVVPWFAGTPAAEQPVAERTAWAAALADALAALHVPAPADAPVNPVRGGALAGRAAALAERLAAGHLDAVVPDARARAERLWADALAAPAWPGPPVWLHGDPHPANLLVGPAGGRATSDEDAPGPGGAGTGGPTAPAAGTRTPPASATRTPTTSAPEAGTDVRAPLGDDPAATAGLAALIDFGDTTAGDPACDLATAWLTFDAPGRAAFRARVETYPVHDPAHDPGLWTRAAGWALVMSSAMVTHGDDDPVIAAIGTHALRELLG